MASEPPPKRTKLSSASSLNRDISPPPLRRQATVSLPMVHSNSNDISSNSSGATFPSSEPDQPHGDTLIVSSPFKLTHIHDFPANKNIDAIRITDILSYPLLREVWSFNFMHDLPWLVSHLDPDTANSIDIKVVHGNWRKESASRIQLEEDKAALEAAGYNIELITAYMANAFGTHHTKMMILFSHEDTAQVIIHTANMIPHDWENMTQAVWRSPWLPLLEDDSMERKDGVGWSFKEGLMAYLGAYEWRTKKLMDQLRLHDFKNVRAVFVGHVPGDHPLNGPENKLFGWAKVRRVLTRVGRGGGWGVNKAGRCTSSVTGGGEMTMQCSSVASMGEAYLENVLLPAFSASRANGNTAVNAFSAMRSPSSSSKSGAGNGISYSLVFPTAENVRTSTDGWNGGGPIFLKSKSAADKSQLKYLRPMMAVWGQPRIGILNDIAVEADRGKALPHIKTYNFFSPPETKKKDEGEAAHKMVAMDWAMITSANLSKQAWGLAAKDKEGTSKIQSYEVGVLVHPALWKDLLYDDSGVTSMEAVGRMDWILGENGQKVEHTDVNESMNGKWRRVRLGVRLPYDYPLKKYEEKDRPWCQDGDYAESDYRGQIWSKRPEDMVQALLKRRAAAQDDNGEDI
ncbi:hypothetical protein H072_7245 [Dactylellina haptotyla CBS 200.50]|uniref:PLD phosphodiesterase domain-containing protein n=1 Tax=Dactylellina haptotyla (strain CBS 200.50) TaxID=1284197 RepID=S8AD06_DACHA|nr:hypothetical protein H072_7245 [Dactylellina haptotyla CBS 200.50]